MAQIEEPPTIVALGTYDLGKPRTRILLRGLRENGAEVIECHRDVWDAVEDKSQVRGVRARLAIVRRLLVAYPVLAWRYLRLPKHDVVLIGYLGLFDVLLLWPLVRIRRAALVWDVFLSLYNTVVEDRRMVSKGHPAALALWSMEWLALRLVDLALMDTQAHADYLCTTYRCEQDKVARIFVGVEPERFDLKANRLVAADPMASPKQILFYGQFIPLHGIDTVVRAAKLTESEHVRWLMIGKGQEAEKIRTLVDDLDPSNLEWIEWVEYARLIEYLAGSHVALGIFGTTDKAKRVIPNKVYQILAAGRPLITADTPAVRELLCEDECVTFVPAGCPEALAESVSNKLRLRRSDCTNIELIRRFRPQSLGASLLKLLMTKCNRKPNE